MQRISQNLTSPSAVLHSRLWVELTAIFVGFPLLVLIAPWLGFRIPWAPFLLAGCVAAAIWLVRVGGLKRHQFWRGDNPAAEKAQLRTLLIRFVMVAVTLTVLVALFAPDRLFSLLLNRPQLWLGIMFFYPLFSVYPQELLYRLFFLRRYAMLLSEPRAIILLNALVFGWAHVFFPAPLIGVSLCIGGGLLFAQTFVKTGSLRLAALEHALYGNLIFTIGLGEFFFSGRR
jgi:uncharacterized protein